ncbi:hypothetical protein BKA63DRAFT_522656 [Paraphoma chrysanthemicola]|nr:hypothetical protein BKA63DRAFT_522656 [Paraphoma chrysanthemicola]
MPNALNPLSVFNPSPFFFSARYASASSLVMFLYFITISLVLAASSGVGSGFEDLEKRDVILDFFAVVEEEEGLMRSEVAEWVDEADDVDVVISGDVVVVVFDVDFLILISSVLMRGLKRSVWNRSAMAAVVSGCLVAKLFIV